ncbi:MAG: replication initiation protein [Salinivenus sp.]
MAPSPPSEAAVRATSDNGSTPSASDAARPDATDGPDASDIVVKANQLIRGRINWTKLEHRVVAMLIAQLKREDDAFTMQRVHISDLMEMAQVSSRDIYNRAEEVCRKLLNQKVHVRTSTEDGRRVYQGYNCLSTCRYVEGSGYIEAKFNDDMKPFLLQLKRQFTMYRLQNFMQLGSQHSMRMYELIKMREGLRYLSLSVEELREVLCCEHTYERFSDFRRHVLERARTEIRDICDVYYTYTIERSGRTPKRVHFFIHRQDGAERKAPILRKRESPAETLPDGGGPSTPNGELDASPATNGEHDPTWPPGQRVAQAATRFNLYASVLARFDQDALEDLSTSTVREAIEQGKREVIPASPKITLTAVAKQVATAAADRLRPSASS